MWWTGPEWLSKNENEWPLYSQEYVTELERKKLPVNAFVNVKTQNDEYLVGIMKKHSKLSRLLWNTARVVQFCNIRKPRPPKEVSLPNAQDLREALRCWTRYTQNLVFKDEIERCKAGDELLVKSKLLKLRPFVDQHGILRVGGRLGKSELPNTA